MTSTQKTATSFLPSNEACDQKVEGGGKVRMVIRKMSQKQLRNNSQKEEEKMRQNKWN